MGETLGNLKVIIVRGKRLAVRDFKSSDPYVVVKLGNQEAKTRVINSNLNPVWNEELTFSIRESAGTLNLEVYDRDFLKADDKMGHAHLSLHPLISAARLMQILVRKSSSPSSSGREETKTTSTKTTTTNCLRKVIPEKDNCLATESTISCCINDSKVVEQDVWLRLSDVESGEIELKLFLTLSSP